ncbi:MAG TPA: LamB/YcsF family protein, partial [Thermoanaerobaculia bacterium]|nr:LamB/YcsF family protein [Thermoanaerobaculia bacterium]
EAGLPVAAEAFADRRYLADGSLVPRGSPGAVLSSPEEAVEQALSIARDGVVHTGDGSTVSVRADTLCLHGDTPGAPEFARRIRERFREEGIRVAPLEVTPSRDRRAQGAAPLH